MGHERKVAFVTGGAQGIGRAVSQRLLREGYSVAMVDADAKALKKTQMEFNSPGDLLPIKADVSKEKEVDRAVAKAVAHFGQLDLLVNNAGVFAYSRRRDIKTWHHILGVNLHGTFFCAHYAEKHLRKARGCIINLASTRALMSEPNTEAYSATKGAIVALSHALSISLGPAVRVNSISPGWIQTDPHAKMRPIDHAQHPVGRVGRPEDVAGLVAYLASGEAGFITGQNFIIDGGMTRKMIYAE